MGGDDGLLLLKLTLTPLVVGGATIASRRWGPLLGGLFVALPFTSGPILVFLALGEGPAFAARTAVGTLLGVVAIVAFGVAWVAAAARGPVAAFAAATAAYVAAALVLREAAGLPFPLLLAVALAVIGLALRVVPAQPRGSGRGAHPAWDLPARIAVGTALVVGLTAVAPLLGPVASGLVATFPVYVSVLAAFGQLHEGPPGAVAVVRGLLSGLAGTAAFYACVHLLVERAGPAPAFLAGVVVALLVGLVALRRIRTAGPARWRSA